MLVLPADGRAVPDTLDTYCFTLQCPRACVVTASPPPSSAARISEELLPTPAKSHYTFNLRDLSKVFQGLLMITSGSCPNRDVMMRLWMHEACRVFHDR